MAKLIKRICKREDIKLTERELDELSDAVDGAPRRALVMLDMIANLDEKDRVGQIKDILAAKAATIDLCRALIRKDNWTKVSKILLGLTDDTERIRHGVLGYAASIMIKPGAKGKERAYEVATIFEDNFYDSKRPGLIRACYEAIL